MRLKTYPAAPEKILKCLYRMKKLAPCPTVKTNTPQEIENIQIEILRKMKPEERLETTFGLFEIERKLLIEGIRNRHQQYSGEEVRLALIRIMIPYELFEKAYPQAKEWIRDS